MVVASVLLSPSLLLLLVALIGFKGWVEAMFSLGCARSECESMLGKCGATRQWLSGCYSKASAGAPTINTELLPAKPRLFMSTQRAGIKNRPCID